MNEEKNAVMKVETPEVVNVTALERIEHATIDCQIATAHQYPRSMTLFKKRALEMVTLDEETAQSCIYRRPVGKKGNQVEYAEGKSIRMAEIIGACYGNLRVGSILIEQTERFVKARGMAHDLESNFAASSEVVESTVTKEGMPFSERMRIVVAKAALAKARRDATFQVVPGALCKSLEEAARTAAIGTTATIGKRRTVLLDWINKLGIDAGRVWQALGIKGIEDVGLEQLETLTGVKTAIKDGDVSVDEAFPIEIKKPVPRMFKKQTEESNLPENDEMPKDIAEEKNKRISINDGGNSVGKSYTKNDLLQMIQEEIIAAGVGEGKLLTLLRKDEILTQYQNLEDLTLEQAGVVYKTIGAYIGRAKKETKKE